MLLNVEREYELIDLSPEEYNKRLLELIEKGDANAVVEFQHTHYILYVDPIPSKDKKDLEKNITELTEIIDKREKELNDIKTSATYRFAKCLSAPFRALKKIIKRKR